MFSLIHLFQFVSTQICRFVQFGEDQNCYCGALSCRQKLGNKPSKPKLSSDAALKLVAPEVAVSSPSVKGLLSKNDVSSCWVYDIQFCLFSLIFWHILLDLETKMTNFCNLRVVLYDTCIEECVSNGLWSQFDLICNSAREHVGFLSLVFVSANMLFTLFQTIYESQIIKAEFHSSHDKWSILMKSVLN